MYSSGKVQKNNTLKECQYMTAQLYMIRTFTVIKNLHVNS